MSSAVSLSSDSAGETQSTGTREYTWKNLGEKLGTELSTDFDYHGGFYFAQRLPVRYGEDDPDLSIEGVGKVKLPLDSEKEAQKIINCAVQAPFGRGEETVIDTKIRDTWQIDASKISIGNPAWLKRLETQVLPDVCKGLGVDMTTNNPRLELYKLLLYTRGSHFAAHQDTKKADGMFATLVVDLPAPHTGGTIVVSHCGERKRIAFSWWETMDTHILAWYTDVVHEVERITEGYRIILSYNLIHGQPNPISPIYQSPSPITDEVKIQRLREVLEGWDAGRYGASTQRRREPDLPFFAFVLDHNYSASDLASGISCLKGADSHKVGLLAPLAERFNVKLALVTVEHMVSGAADDYDQYQEDMAERRWLRQCEMERERKGRVGNPDDEDESDEESDDETDDEEREFRGVPSMLPGGRDEWTLTFKKVVDVHGEPFAQETESKDPVRDKEEETESDVMDSLVLDNYHGVLIPEGAFKTQHPDEEVYEKGYMGNECGNMTYWYHRAVLIMYHGRDEEKVLSIVAFVSLFRGNTMSCVAS